MFVLHSGAAYFLGHHQFTDNKLVFAKKTLWQRDGAA